MIITKDNIISLMVKLHMKKIYTIALIALIIGNKISLAQILPVNEVIQEQSEWCWAGVSKCILDYYGNVIEQCEIVEYTRTVATWHDFGDTNCCNDPYQGCNYWNYNYGTNGSILNILNYFGNINNYGSSMAMSEPDIQTEFENGRPFVIRWAWDTGGGHFVVGYGKENQMIYYMNPWYGEGMKMASYDWMVDGGTHKWTHTNILTTSPTAVPDIKVNTEMQINIMPNPTSGHVLIKFNTKTDNAIKLEIINSSGQSIYSKNIINTLLGAQLFFDLPNGLYLVKAISDGFVCTKKLIVK